MSDQPEEMGAFFNARAEGYDDHMRKVLDAPAFYGAIAEAVAPTDDPIAVLDLGCGTGLELAGIFARARKVSTDHWGMNLTHTRRLRRNFEQEDL